MLVVLEGDRACAISQLPALQNRHFIRGPYTYGFSADPSPAMEEPYFMPNCTLGERVSGIT
jgi:hypothetical protein